MSVMFHIRLASRFFSTALCVILHQWAGAYQAAKDTAPDLHLFDFTELLFQEGADATRKKWEAEFIAFGRKTEKTPQNYVRHTMTWFELDGQSKSLLQYKTCYVWNTGLYGYRFFVDPASEIYSTRESLQEAYLISHVSRDQANLERLWNHFGFIVAETMAPYMLKGKAERRYVQGLVDAWTCITGKKKYEQKLETIYEALITENPDCDQMFEYIKPLMCDDLNEQFDRHEDYNRYRDVQWIYSFWVRRHHEGNTEITLKILESLL